MTETMPMPHEALVAPAARNGQVARQGFGEQSLERRSSAAMAMAERARAEVQARYIVALQRPRDVDEFRVRLLDHCKRDGFARAARYKKPIGNTSIEGLSVRFVETALAEYGNVSPETTIIYEDDDQVTIRATVTDLERNVTHASEATIAKRMERRSLRPGQKPIGQRVNSTGQIVYLVEATEDDVANMTAARASKLLRNLGLRILPRDIVDEAEEQCKATLRTRAVSDPAGERRKLVDAFHGIGVSPSALVEYLGHPLEQLQPPELLDLREVYAAIKEGEATWPAVMAARRGTEEKPEAPTSGVAAVKEKLFKGRKKAAPTAELVTQPPDELDQEVRDIKESLEQVLAHPEWMPGLRARVYALPPDALESVRPLFKRAEAALEKVRAEDDIPPFDVPEEQR